MCDPIPHPSSPTPVYLLCRGSKQVCSPDYSCTIGSRIRVMQEGFLLPFTAYDPNHHYNWVGIFHQSVVGFFCPPEQMQVPQNWNFLWAIFVFANFKKKFCQRNGNEIFLFSLGWCYAIIHLNFCMQPFSSMDQATGGTISPMMPCGRLSGWTHCGTSTQSHEVMGKCSPARESIP